MDNFEVEQKAREYMSAAYDCMYAIDDTRKEGRRLARKIDIEGEKFIITDDSPFWAKYSMVRRLYDELLQSEPGQSILEVGSGKQILPLMMYRLPAQKKYEEFDESLLEIFQRTSFLTLDIAYIDPRALLGYKPDYEPQNTQHIRGDAMSLPVASGSLPFVVTNFSIDFIPGRVQMFKEVHRVLREGGTYLANFHHRFLEDNGDGRLRLNNGVVRFEQLAPLYSCPEEFLTDLSIAGFDCTRIDYSLRDSLGKRGVSERDYDLWWEIKIEK